MDVLIGKYAGHSWTDRHITVPVTGLRELVTSEWPDLRLPSDIVLLPREDYDILQGDLVGQVYTPHRTAIALRVLSEDPPRNRLKDWPQALVNIAGIIALACLFANAIADVLK